MKEKERDRLFIPVNVRKRKEYVDGFGKDELIKSLIATAFGVVLGIVLFLRNNYQPLYIALVPVVVFAISVIFLRKDKTNTNALDSICEMYEFSKSQKKYEYEYVNIYEKEVEKKEHDKEIKDINES